MVSDFKHYPSPSPDSSIVMQELSVPRVAPKSMALSPKSMLSVSPKSITPSPKPISSLPKSIVSLSSPKSIPPSSEALYPSVYKNT